MVSAPPAIASGGLFKSPFPKDATPSSPPPADPRAHPGAGGDQRSQRPDLEVDWSHLERERAAIAENKARREGERRDANNRYGGPLIGANEIGTGQLSERDERDDRHERDERHERRARDDRDERDERQERGHRAYRDEPADEYPDEYAGYGDDGRDERRSRRRAHGDERDRYDNHDRDHDRDHDRGRRERSARGGRAGAARRHRHEDDDAYDARDGGGYDDRHDQRYNDRHNDRHNARGAGQGQMRAERHARQDEAGAWDEPRDGYGQAWGARGAAPLAQDESGATGEQYVQGGGLWGDAPAQGDSAYLGAPAVAGKASGRSGKSGVGAKGRKKGIFTRTWLIGSTLASALVFILLRVGLRLDLQRVLPFGAHPTPTASSAQTFTDSLLTNKNGWLTNANCIFKPDGYHLTRGYLAYAPVADAKNFDIIVQAKQTTGTLLAPYGLVFRRVSLGNYYVFGIDGNGKWTFYKAMENVATDIVSYTASPAIKQGLNAQNTLEVKANGSHFTFFVNATQVGQADDTSLATAGSLGVAGHDDIEVIFTSFTLIRLA